ncbi:MAG: hypothetical protein RMI92_10535 [Geminocystis sp.]|nr:hypothetical protein [Geminocystis sp.]
MELISKYGINPLVQYNALPYQGCRLDSIPYHHPEAHALTQGGSFITILSPVP